MQHVNHWDYAERFTGREAAFLIAGFDPSSNLLEDSYRVQPIIRRMKEAYYSACSDFRFDVDGAAESDGLMFSRNTKAEGNLLSIEIATLVRDFENSEFAKKDIFLAKDLSAKYEAAFSLAFDPLIAWNGSDAHEFDDQYFSRSELQRWITANGLASSYLFGKTHPASVVGETFPWGQHNTVLLSRLAEAAMQFWSLYDPDEPSTAPTNDQVRMWLVERGVTERIADAMATILRADGLRSGRRK
ncbi:hypothetical protein GJ698_02830 [Pseudoduganella sp. FT26W]|uniref:Uncharacterized protein n=1 Tax=Duganella aquatilis TaxID=2666082 RepID=A0A844D830_9BURK|nr:hypothetical protein [Duganella aquatilis]MRW83024.1 hypothetical protein [Duganella aquatilis]